jgi:hypothetical protein
LGDLGRPKASNEAGSVVELACDLIGEPLFILGQPGFSLSA